ncbi:SDR family NAD(P)-dependent oxidoreductase [Streptomyces sp. KMM 9044]|uniref:SDR family NAD(P)-dependent oxidoreductase n=1 Tax=Streptomyces sp. KMM 9044 TaxID=2744474 RepID=UPI002151AA01|nr:SDR family NAD(P)-dependent oxidoreductase [Streptomyces sp. KMM 9044]WAX80624.1 SDR family NAD(P)-dependent oxidoreductase [Streptomyces sp. KMM 9044]
MPYTWAPRGARRAGRRRPAPAAGARHNAGVPVNVPVEVLPMAEWRQVLKANLFGHLAVIQALLPALLCDKGRVINISSIGDKHAMAAYGAYAGAEFAPEAVGDSLRRKAAPLVVQVVVAEPGGVRTETAARGIATADDLAARMTPEQEERHGSLVRANNELTASGTASGLTAGAAARVVAKAVTARRPRTRCTAGRDAALIMGLGRMLSDRTPDRVLAAGLRRHHPKGAVGRRGLRGQLRPSGAATSEETRRADGTGSPTPASLRNGHHLTNRPLAP